MLPAWLNLPASLLYLATEPLRASSCAVAGFWLFMLAHVLYTTLPASLL